MGSWFPQFVNKMRVTAKLINIISERAPVREEGISGEVPRPAGRVPLVPSIIKRLRTESSVTVAAQFRNDRIPPVHLAGTSACPSARATAPDSIRSRSRDAASTTGLRWAQEERDDNTVDTTR